MGSAYFYHLTEQPLEVVLRALVAKSCAAGWRVLIRGPAPLLVELDQQLWLGDPASFLPHGLAGGPHDAAQPVLLGSDVATEGFDGLMCVGGAPLSSADAGRMARASVIFDGADEAAVETARAQWRSLTDAGVTAQYWAQEDGRWVKKAQSGGLPA